MLSVFFIMYIGFKLYNRKTFIKSDQVDLKTNRDIIDADERQFADDRRRH